MNRLPPLIERHPPVKVPEAPGTARVQCVACRWHGARSEMRQTFVNRTGETRACPQCGAVKVHYLEDGESPLPLFPMEPLTREWLNLAGFADWGLEKNLRVFAHRETKPNLLLKLRPETTIAEVLSILWRMGSDDQAERYREALAEAWRKILRGQPMAEAKALTEELCPKVVDPLTVDDRGLGQGVDGGLPEGETDWRDYHDGRDNKNYEK